MRVGSSEEKNNQTTFSRQANGTFSEFLFGESSSTSVYVESADEPLLNDSPAFDLLSYSPIIDDELNLNSLNISYTPDSDLHLPGNSTFKAF